MQLTGGAVDERGFTLLEVLITLVILAFGLLGLAGLQTTMHLAEVEAYQRAQAILLLQDMAQRIQAGGAVVDPLTNRLSAAAYETGTDAPRGTGTAGADCTALTDAARDLCEWSDLLKGASETRDSANVGAMVGARGCVELVQEGDATDGTCAPGIYRVSVAWQGLNPTTAPSSACGAGQYGDDDDLRRVVSYVITIGVPTCM